MILGLYTLELMRSCQPDNGPCQTEHGANKSSALWRNGWAFRRGVVTSVADIAVANDAWTVPFPYWGGAEVLAEPAGIGKRFRLGIAAVLEQVPASLFTLRSTIRTSLSTSLTSPSRDDFDILLRLFSCPFADAVGRSFRHFHMKQLGEFDTRRQISRILAEIEPLREIAISRGSNVLAIGWANLGERNLRPLLNGW
jgi:hypothetical protein